jgi:Tfp pilus assembly protein FimV
LLRKLRDGPSSAESKAVRAKEQAASAKLDMARSLLKDGKTARARERLARVVAECDGTEAARMAAALLKELGP